jgi:hypothetical protein
MVPIAPDGLGPVNVVPRSPEPADSFPFESFYRWTLQSASETRKCSASSAVSIKLCVSSRSRLEWTTRRSEKVR